MMTEMWMRFFYSPGVNLVNSHRASWGKDRCRCDKLFVYEIRVWCLLYTIPAILRKVAASMLRYYEVCEQLFYRKRKWITRPFDKFGWFQENSDELLTILQNLRRMNNFMGFNGWNHFGVFELKSCTRSWGIGSSTISRCTIFQNSAVEVSTISRCTIFQNSVEVPTISCGTIFRNSVGSTTISRMLVSTTYRNLVHSSNCAIFRVLQSIGEFWTLSNFRAGIDLHLENCSMQFFLLEGEYVGVGVSPLMN